MIVSIVPQIIDALVAKATTALPGVTVLDGQGVTGDTGSMLLVGANTEDATIPSTAAQAQQAPATFSTNRTREQSGDIYLTAASWNGDGDQKAARDDAYATATAVAALCRADPSLGITTAQMVVCGFGGTEQLDQDQDSAGASASLTFTVHFQARI